MDVNADPEMEEPLVKPNRTYFNSCIVVGMELKVLTMFAIVASLHSLGQTFGVSHNVILQTATIYEVGKLFGAVGFGLLLPRYNMITVFKRAMEVYMGLIIVWLIFTVAKQNKLKGWIVPFFIFYFFLSIVCISTQFGLNVLKISNTGDGTAYRRWVLYQAILASFCQALFTIIGGLLLEVIGPFSGFYSMLAYCLLCRILLQTAVTDHVFEMLQPTADKASEPVKEAFTSYCSACWTLCTDRRFRVYQGYLATVGSSSGAMYSFAPTVTLLYNDENNTKTWEADIAGTAKWTVSVFVAVAILSSLVSRLISLPLVEQYSSRSMVTLGMCLILTGSALFFIIGNFTLIVSGWFIFSGLGLAMTMSKNGGMLAVKDKHLGTYAASMIKATQLIIGALCTGLCAVAYNNTAIPMGIILFTVNLIAFLIFLWTGTLKPVEEDDVLDTDDDLDQPLLSDERR